MTPGRGTVHEEVEMSPTGAMTALLIGLVVGLLARLVIPTRRRVPMWLTLAAGVIGALVGTFLAQAIGVSAGPVMGWSAIALAAVTGAAGVAAAAGGYGRQSAAR
jgi:uncharacterized membrane protein YeaQ/YmgE (transglycosylase-associated protein family)